MDFTSLLLEGFGGTVLIVMCSIILPLIIGVGVTVLMSCTKKTIIPNIIKYASVILESLAPAALLLFVFFSFGRMMRVSSFWAVIITFNICFLMYLPQKYDKRDSLVKNILVNSVDLIACVFKWSMIGSLVGAYELLWYGRRMISVTYDMWHLLVPLIVSFIVLAILYTVRNILRDVLK